MKKYVISPITLFDADENLYFTKMGVEGKNMPLHYTVWGKTSDESRKRANQLGEILTKHYTDSLKPVDQ
jgi:macrodomain Ter protein organizer (MatP/YcbG family)